MDEITLKQFNQISQLMRRIVYSIQQSEHMLFDLDSTLLNTYGNQEGEAFNYHYQAHGYHPLLCYDGITGDLLKMKLRDGTHYCSNGADEFILPLLQEFRTKYPSLPLQLRGYSGFATPSLYDVCEDNDCKYSIRLEINSTLIALAEDSADELRKITKYNAIDYALTYGEFMYQASSWSHPRRIIYKIEKLENHMTFMYTFIVTTMESKPQQVVQFYCGRGKMEKLVQSTLTVSYGTEGLKGIVHHFGGILRSLFS